MTSRIRGALICALAIFAAGATTAQAQPLAGKIPDRPHVARISREVPAHSANLPYGGGPVLHWNRTHVIFWQPSGSGLSFEPGYEALIEGFLRNVAAASRSPSSVYGLTGQYRDPHGPAAYNSIYGGAVTATDPLPANSCTEPAATGPGWSVCLTDQQLQDEIERVVRRDRLPTRSIDLYFLVNPNGLGSCKYTGLSDCALGGRKTGYCGYHSQTVDGLVLYAVIPYNAVPRHCQSEKPRPNHNTADPALSTISHEHSEMITDPNGYNGWIDPITANEDGDLCLKYFGPAIGGSGASAWNEQIGGGHYYLQEEWSNVDRTCEPRAKADSVGFRTTPARGHASTILLRGHARAPHAAIVAYQWFLGDHRTARGRRATHRYRHPGAYRVVLRTTDSWGNWAFYARTVVVRAGRGARAARATKSG